MTDRYHTRKTFRGESVTGSFLPSAHSIVQGDYNRRAEAEEGSRQLLKALERYFARGGRA
jgi:hypothetical protein